MGETRVLVAENDGVMALILTNSLDSLGYTLAATAVTGEQALSLAADLRPDLVLMEGELAGPTDGIESARQIQERFNIPVVYVTASPGLDVIERMKDLEPAGYLVKPVAAGALHFTMQAAIRSHKLKEDLRTSKRLFESTFASLGEAVFIIDAATVEIIDCNPAASDMFGYSREEILGRTTTFLHIDEAALELFRSSLYPAIEEAGFLLLSKFRMKRKDGTAFPTEHRVTPLEDEHGRCVGWVSVVHDITVSQEVEEKLSRSLERLDLATRAAGLGIWDWDIVRNELIWDDTMYALYGTHREDFGGDYEAWLARVHPDDPAVNDALTRGAQRGDKNYDTQFRVVWPDGTIHVLRAYGQTIWDDAGNPVRMTGVNYDITEQVEAEVMRQRQSQLVTETLESIGDAFFALDEDLKVTYFNQAAERLLGKTRNEVRGRNLFEVFPEARGSIFEEQYRRALAEKRAASFETYFDKAPYADWYSVKVYPQESGISVYFQIITERKEAEEVLRDSEERYRRLAGENANLVHEVNHRVGNNLALLLALLDWTIDEMPLPETRQALQDMRGRVDSMAEVHRLLNRTGWAPIDLRQLIQPIVSGMLAAAPPFQQIEYRLECPVEPVLVAAKPAFKIALILNELMTNSLKYAFVDRKEGQITIDLRVNGPWIELIFTDDGPGWPEDVLSGERQNMGLSLIHATIEREMEGTLNLHNNGGATAHMKFVPTAEGEFNSIRDR